jgi:hypothetical protein
VAWPAMALPLAVLAATNVTPSRCIIGFTRAVPI